MYSTLAQNRSYTLSGGAFYNRVYAWMASGLALTGVVGMLVHNSPTFTQIAHNGWVLWPLFILQLLMVMVIAGGAEKLGAGIATFLFMVYSATNGVTLSSIFEIYTKHSIVEAFGITAGMFAIMSIYGFVTKRDLTSMGAFFGMALWGLILALIVSIFWANTWLEYAINFGGVIIFTGLTAYDTQKLKDFSNDERLAPVGSLILYLDFLNLFIFMLRILGGKGKD